MNKNLHIHKIIITIICLFGLISLIGIFHLDKFSDNITEKISFMDELEHNINLYEDEKEKTGYDLLSSMTLEELDVLDENNKDFIDYGTVITLELKSDYDASKERDILLSKYTYNELQNEKLITDIIMELRATSKNYYSSLRSSLAEKYNLNIDVNVASPMITIYENDDIDCLSEIPKELIQVIKDESIYKAYIRDWRVYSNKIDLNRADPDNNTDVLTEDQLLNLVSAQNAVKQYDGTGVKIGIFEVRETARLLKSKGLFNDVYEDLDNYGQPNTSYFPLNTKSILRNPGNSSFSYHATSTGLASMMLAPKATYYFSSVENNLTIDFPSQIQWFLDNEVTIINFSAGMKYVEAPAYYEQARTWDMLVRDNYFTAVVSAGNSGTYLGSPAIASNVITVGASNLDGDARADFSSYMKPKGNINMSKPNLIAPGRGFGLAPYKDLANLYPEHHKRFPLYPVAGTSFSSPMVTGAIGLLLEMRPILALHPEAIQALVNSSADTSNISKISNYYAGFDNEVGAGMLNVQRLLDNAYNFSSWFVRDDSNVKNYVLIQSVFVPSGKTIKIDLFWFANIVGATTKISDFDLLIYDESGNVVGTSRTAYSNNELLTYSPSVSGTYKIYLQQWDNLASANIEILGLAWSIY